MSIKSYYILVLLAFFVFGCISEPNQKEQITPDKLKKERQDSLITATDQAIKNGDTISIARFYKNLLTTDTTNINFYIYYSGSLCLNGRPDRALQYLDRAERLNANLSTVYYGKGLAWSFLNRDSMYFYHSKAIALDSLNVYYLTFRSKLYQEDSLYEKALADINRAINVQPKNEDLYVFRGVYEKELGLYKEALEDLSKIPKSRVNDYQFYLNRGFVYLRLKMYKECIEDSNKSIELNPNVSGLYLMRGNAKSNLKDFDGAYVDIKKSAEMGNSEAVEIYKKYKGYYDTYRKS